MSVNPRRTGRPPLISRGAVLTKALQIVDADGLDALTMRRLGAELGVDPMAVYRHVSDKAALYDGLVESVYAAIEYPPRTGDWSADFPALIRALRTTLLAHPSVVPLLGTRPVNSPGGFRAMEAALTVLLDAGFSPQDAADAVDCAARLVVGHVLAEAGSPPVPDLGGGEAEHRQRQAELPAQEFPGLTAVNQAGVRHDAGRLFEKGLRGLTLELARTGAVNAPAPPR